MTWNDESQIVTAEREQQARSPHPRTRDDHDHDYDDGGLGNVCPAGARVGRLHVPHVGVCAPDPWWLS